MATPPPPFSRWALVEQRLLYLEQREDANTRDILKLKSDNAELLTSNLELKQQNAKTVKEKKAVEDRLSKLETETKDAIGKLTVEVNALRGLQRLLNDLVVKGYEGTLKKEIQALRTKVANLDVKTEAMNGKVGTVETKMVVLSDNTKAIGDSLDGRLRTTNDKLQALDKDVTEIEDEVSTNREKLTKQERRLKSMEDDVKAHETRIKKTEDDVKTHETRIKKTEDDIKTHETRIKKTEDDVKTHETRIKKTEDDVKTLDDNSRKQAKDIDLQKTSVVKANIKPSKPLETGTLTKLDCIDDVIYTLGSCLKKDTCEYHTPVKGVYGVGVRLCCTGKGRMKARVFCDEEIISTGWTNENGLCHIFFVINSDKGSKWNVRVVKEGEAEFQFCEFACFLLSPL